MLVIDRNEIDFSSDTDDRTQTHVWQANEPANHSNDRNTLLAAMQVAQTECTTFLTHLNLGYEERDHIFSARAELAGAIANAKAVRS